MEMSQLLAAECVFCGYNGEGYWQVGTHAKDCPWFNIGGEAERAAKVGVFMRIYYKEYLKEEETLSE